MNKKNSNIIVKIIIPLIICFSFFSLSALSIKEKTNTFDEGFHMVRGIMLLKTGDYRLNQHHPILANVIHSIPAVLNPNLKTQSLKDDDWIFAKKDEMGWELIKINGGDIEFSKNILYQSRLLNILLSTIFLFVFYQIIFKLFNSPTAIISTIGLSTSPTFIAHSSLVTTDTPVTSLIFLGAITTFLFIKNYENIKKRKIFLILFILISFLSLITKYTAVIPFLISLLFITTFIFFKERDILKTIKYFSIIILTTFFLCFASWSFHTGTLKESAYNNTEKIQDDYNHINRLPTQPINLQGFMKNTYENISLPMPEYIRGFYENVFKHNLYGHTTFFLGEFSSKGWWNYFPTAFALKEPLSIVFLTTFSISFSMFYFIKNKKINFEYLILFLIPFTLLLLSMKSSLNLGIRHLLPIYPFIFLLIGVVFNYFYNRYKLHSILIISPIIIFLYFSVLTAFPHYIEYFNEAIGNPQNGYKYLRDSNLDWGQNKYLVEKYKEENKDKDFKIVRVESLFNRDERISEEMRILQKKYLNNELEIIDYISNTHWVIKEEK